MASYPSLSGEDLVFCASCTHSINAHLDGVGDCIGGSFHDPCRCNRFVRPVGLADVMRVYGAQREPANVEKLQAEVKELRENKARLAAAYHALDARCDRYKAALDYLSAQYDLVVDIHSRVRMDTPEDRELHERTIAAMRFAHETVRAALQEES